MADEIRTDAGRTGGNALPPPAAKRQDLAVTLLL